MDSARQALRLLRAYGLRSVLTLFGLVWGTASVVFLVGWGESLEEVVDRGFEKAGRDLGQLSAGTIGEEFTPSTDRRQLLISWQDVAAIRRQARLARAVGAETRRYLPVTAGSLSFHREVRGVEPEGLRIRAIPVAQGRTIRPGDVRERRPVAVLGFEVAEELYGARPAVGRRLRIDGRFFEVVGRLERMGAQFGQDGEPIDDQIWIPITTHFASWPTPGTEPNAVSTVLYRLSRSSTVDATEDELRRLLAERLGVDPKDEEAIVGWSASRTLAQIPLGELRGILALLSVTTLAISGIGVLNLMLDTVRQRRREIGLRLAVGARPLDVVVQFLIETATIVALGGLLGIAIALALILAFAAVDLPEIIPVPRVSVPAIALALGVMSAVGLIAGGIPALRAARVDPASTLRSDG